MLSLVAAGLLWSAAVQAVPISYSYTDYYAYASAENTVTGRYDKEVTSQPLPPISAFAQRGSNTAYASGGIEKFLFAEASVSNENQLAQSWIHADLGFTASSDQLFLKFDYYLEASAAGDGAAEAQLYLYLDDWSWFRDDITAYASPGNPYIEVSDINSGSIDEVLAVTPGQEYHLWLEIWWVYGESYTGTDAYAQAWIDNFSLDDGTVAPPPTHSPAPATWLLLSSGLAVLLGWRRRR
jgi:MYXO-CTERM domain-containing protein